MGNILCNTPSCTREILTGDTVIPKLIKNNSLYLEKYSDHFRSIGQGLVVLGCVQSIFNVRLSTFSKDHGVEEIITALTNIHENQVFSYKVALSFGRLLTCTEDAEENVMYFHASANNASVFYDSDDHHDPYFLIRNAKDFEVCLEVIRSKVKEDTHRPSTKWSVVGNVNANITLLRPSGGDILLGRLDRIPPSFRKCGMMHFHRDPVSKRGYRDNLCFFRCLSYHLHKTTKETVTLFRKAFPGRDHRTFEGIKLADLEYLENLFQVNVLVFNLGAGRKNSKKVKIVRSKLCGNSERSVLILNMHKNHLSLIVDMKKYGKVYSCDKCHKVFGSAYNLKRHTAVTKDYTKVRFLYKGGVYKPAKTVFLKLAEVGVHTPDELKIYPYKIVFDFESYFTKVESNDKEKNTTLEVDHVPLSASVACDFPGYLEPVCFVRATNKSDDDIVHRVLEYIDSLGCIISESVRESFKGVLDELNDLEAKCVATEENALKEAGLKKGKHSRTPVQCAREKLLQYINRVPVIGFNSGCYDLNLIKRDFHSYFSAKEKKAMTTIKRCNQYIAVYTQNLMFLDMFNYLAPGYSYANYLKAFLKDTRKGFYPYEWMDNIRKLDNKKLPPRSAFYSSLTGQGISREDYATCQEAWKREKMSTLRDYIVYYNNLDVEPFVRAINEHSKFFTERGVDMFKDGLTLPGLTLKFLFENTSKNATPYVLFSEAERDIHQLLRKNLVGGPSIIFHRHHSTGCH